MKFLRFHSLAIAIILMTATLAVAQQPPKIKRPVKNPPQFPNIIDLEDGKKPPTEEQEKPEPAPQPDALVKAVEGLTGEIRNLIQEVRSLNLRQQAQLDMLRLTRIDLRVDHFDRELRPVRDRINALAAEEQNLYRLMTQESLMAQTVNVSTLSREKTIEQMKLGYQSRLEAVKAEQERLKALESELSATLTSFQKLGADADRRIVEAEQLLRQIENNRTEKKPENQ